MNLIVNKETIVEGDNVNLGKTGRGRIIYDNILGDFDYLIQLEDGKCNFYKDKNIIRRLELVDNPSTIKDYVRTGDVVVLSNLINDTELAIFRVIDVIIPTFEDFAEISFIRYLGDTIYNYVIKQRVQLDLVSILRFATLEEIELLETYENI